jgi:hypothetical protein
MDHPEKTRSRASCNSYNPEIGERVERRFRYAQPARKEHTAPGGATRLRIATLALACAFLVGAIALAALPTPNLGGSNYPKDVQEIVAVVDVRARKVIHMVKVSIEVHNGAARFMVGVKARNIQQALSIVRTRYPATVATVRFPIDLEGFLVEERAA